MARAYYNEIDRFAAAWLRQLIARNLIAPGDVDERSIVDVRPDDLRGYTQCHFFAGIGVWSYALRCAGWPDDRPVWTGSCPCQPFSSAGKGAGVGDERHLWPELFRLILEHRPDVCIGEQVASPAGLAWLDIVSADLERADYAVGAADLCAAGVGAPHIRSRLYWVANAANADRWRGERGAETGVGPDAIGRRRPGIGGPARDMGDPERSRLQERGGDGGARDQAGGTPQGEGTLGTGTSTGGVADDDRQGCDRVEAPRLHERRTGSIGDESTEGDTDGSRRNDADGRGEPGPTNGFWGGADWIPCTDGKARPVEPGSFPLAHGAPARVGRLRGYGNAIVATQAQAFVEAYLDVVAGR